MATSIHFIDVGQGSMVLIQTADGKHFVFDCNITNDNEKRVLAYVGKQMGRGSIHAFICSHRDADHVRGINKLHQMFPIARIWDTDYPGTTTNTDEYREYMELRRKLPVTVIKKVTHEYFGRTHFRYMSAQDDRLRDDANAQGIVLKVEHMSQDVKTAYSSAMLPGDSDARTWREGILQDYDGTNAASSILMASHHGSLSFFDDPNDRYYYTAHLQRINPAMTVVSVGPNQHGHPDAKALEYYEKYSTGSAQGSKVWRTDKQGTMCLTLKDDGGWGLTRSGS